MTSTGRRGTESTETGRGLEEELDRAALSSGISTAAAARSIGSWRTAARRRADTVILLGDVIDRGPDSRGVLQRIVELEQTCATHLILENHEEMLLSALHGYQTQGVAAARRPGDARVLRRPVQRHPRRPSGAPARRPPVVEGPHERSVSTPTSSPACRWPSRRATGFAGRSSPAASPAPLRQADRLRPHDLPRRSPLRPQRLGLPRHAGLPRRVPDVPGRPHRRDPSSERSGTLPPRGVPVGPGVACQESRSAVTDMSHASQHRRPTGSRHPGRGVQGAECPLPAGGLSPSRTVEECVSKRGQRAVCPLTNPPGLQSGRSVLRSPQRWYHKGDARCVTRFLMEAPPAARVCVVSLALEPQWPWNDGFELAEPCRQRHGSTGRAHYSATPSLSTIQRTPPGGGSHVPSQNTLCRSVAVGGWSLVETA